MKRQPPAPIAPADDNSAAHVGAKSTRRKARRPRAEDVTLIARACGCDPPSIERDRPRRPKEQATPGVPGLKRVASLTDPHLWYWVFRYTNPETGKRASISYGTSVEVPYMEAVARAQRDREMVRRGRNPAASKVTLDVFVETVVTPWARENLRSWKDLISRYVLYFAEPLGAMQISEISAFDVEQVLTELRKPGKSLRRKRLKAATINRAAMALRTIFRLAKQHGLIDHNPLDGWQQLRENPPPPMALSVDEVHRVLVRLQSEQERFRLLIELLLETALRIGEALNARFADVDVQRRLLNLRESKGGGNEIVPLTARALQIIGRLRELSHNDRLFPAARGDGPMSAPRKVLKRVFADVGIDPSACFHTLRKTTASLAASSGIDAISISRLLRHRSIRTTERHYLATYHDNLHRAVNVVSGLISAPAATVKGGGTALYP
ncbi:site-specific integrase [uncultured Zoogloea sp.]|uniref:tyrosine-type recombinase/integrase n=1 Tax=uncultured Zoogloea sp. TaxID=160237 RepID=UPI0026101B8C|nr:site-specific integrase [uncultured Zoogloea sp.]